MVLGWWRQKFWWSIQLTEGFRFRFKSFISDLLLFFNLQVLVHGGPATLEGGEEVEDEKSNLPNSVKLSLES